MYYRYRVPRQISSGQGVSGHLPSECSTYLTDTEYQAKFLPEDTCHGIYLPDEDCQGICLLNATRVFQMQNVKANVDWTTLVMASVFWMRNVRAFTFGT